MVTTSALDFPLLKDASVLVVDDVPVNVQLLSIILRKAGCRVRSASTAAAATALLAKEPQDAILLDVMMPDVSGYDLCQQIRADPRHGSTPVLFISSLGAVADKVRGFAAGGADYVTKPFLAEEVLARLEHHIRLARLHCELVSEKQSLARANQELLRAQRQTAQLFGTVSELLPGRILDGKYRLEQKIGSGGFGVVFRATQLSLQRQVAIKVFRPSTHWASESALQRFLKEGAAMGSLRHAHVVQVFDTAVCREGLAYLVMELLEGRTLAAEIRRVRRMTWERCTAIIEPLMQALIHAHAHNLVHRDIKPENVFLHTHAGAEVVKLLDFGLAKQLRIEEPATVTQAGTMLGTPLYMSPERLRGEAHDGRADVYSIGVLLYEMLTGMLPYSDRTSAELLVQQLTCDPPPLRARCAEVPLPIEQVVLSALHREPEKRPSARELLLLWQSACPGWPHRAASEPTTEMFRPVVSAQAQTVEIPSITLDLKLDALEL